MSINNWNSIDTRYVEMKNLKTRKTAALGLIMLASTLLGTSAMAGDEPTVDDRGDRIEDRLDNKGDRANRRLDNRGKRADRKMDNRAQRRTGQRQNRSRKRS
jgi:hypothetical protein